MKKKISLKWKIARYLLFFAIGLIGLLAVFQLLLLEPMYERYKIATVRRAGDAIVSALQSADSSDLNEKIYEVSAQNDTCVRILSGNSDVMTGNMGCALYRMDTSELIEQYNLAKANDNSYLSTTVTGFGLAGGVSGPGGIFNSHDDLMKNITLTRIIEDADGAQATVMVYTGLSPVNATMQTLRMQILYISLIVAAAMILLVYLMNKHIATPLLRINDAARTLPQGTYDAPASAAEYREAEELNTTLSQAAVDIQKADKAKRDLIANVSHDLRTPLTMISGYGEMMRDLPGEKTDENIQVIIDESHRLTYLVNDLLDLSKLEENKIKLNCSLFDLSALAERELRKYDVYRVSDGFEITSECTPGLIVNADAARIEQVFNNFVINAINYSGNSRKIEVRVFRKENMAHLEVQDHGEGIPADKQKDIWDRYYKVDKEHVRRVNSSGIGLSIAHQVLELHQARYGVISKENEGSTFWFELPIAEETKQKAA